MGQKLEDLSGKDFGMFHVVKQSDEKYITESGIELVQWDCVDKDGNEYKLLRQYLITCPNSYKPYNKKGSSVSKYKNNNSLVKYIVNTWKEQENSNIKHQRKKYDLTGQKFGDWLVLEEGDPYQNKCNQYTRRTWRCKCTHLLRDGEECGNIVDVLEANLVAGKTECCISCSAQNINQIKIGEIYGNYKVLSRATQDVSLGDSQVEWICECQCNLRTIKRLKGVTLLSEKLPRRCGKLGCDESICITNEKGEIIKHICYDCGQMKDLREFRQSALKNAGWYCLNCRPYVQKPTLEQRSLNYRYHFYQKRAEKKKLPFDFTKKEFQELTAQTCFYCGKYSTGGRFKDNYCGIDRLKSDKGYTKDNCVPCCHSCNVMKMDLEPFEFLNQVENISKRLEKITEVLSEEFGITKENEAKIFEEKKRIREQQKNAKKGQKINKNSLD